MPRAECNCGALSAEIEGAEPVVVACHCLECQRRTGAPFGVGAYYPEGAVRIAGAATAYTRIGSSGGAFTSSFCPTCGSSVYWRSERLPGMIGIAVGTLADPAFPAPARSVYEQTKHHWLDLSAVPQHFARGRGG